MKRILILLASSLLLCSTADAFQGGGGESNKTKAETKKNSGTKSHNTRPQPAPILSASTEGETPGAKIASAMIANAVLEELDSYGGAGVRECLSKNQIPPGEVHKLFLSVQLPATSQTQLLYFVRTDIDHPCRLIGAHSFSYWLVVKSKTVKSATYNVRYSGASDAVSILRSIHKGMYDIESWDFSASSAEIVTMQFDGSKYVDTICKEAHRTNRGKEVVKIIPCSTFE